MIRVPKLLAMMILVVLVEWPGAAHSSSAHLELVGLGGWTIAIGPVDTKISGGFFSTSQIFPAQDVFGVECRLSPLWFDSFVGVSYRTTGVLGIGEDSEDDLRLRSHLWGLSAGKNLPMGKCILSVSLGYNYIIDDFSVGIEGAPHPPHRVEDSGCTIGARISAPITRSVAVLWDYQMLIRPSTSDSGDVIAGLHYTVRQGSVHHMILGGISIAIM